MVMCPMSVIGGLGSGSITVVIWSELVVVVVVIIVLYPIVLVVIVESHFRV